jgi:hypothetical protein
MRQRCGTKTGGFGKLPGRTLTAAERAKNGPAVGISQGAIGLLHGVLLFYYFNDH